MDILRKTYKGGRAYGMYNISTPTQKVRSVEVGGQEIFRHSEILNLPGYQILVN